MTSELRERLEVLRRIAERGLKLAQNERAVPEGEDLNERQTIVACLSDRAHKKHLDLWQHMLDELERIA